VNHAPYHRRSPCGRCEASGMILAAFSARNGFSCARSKRFFKARTFVATKCFISVLITFGLIQTLLTVHLFTDALFRKCARVHPFSSLDTSRALWRYGLICAPQIEIVPVLQLQVRCSISPTVWLNALRRIDTRRFIDFSALDVRHHRTLTTSEVHSIVCIRLSASRTSVEALSDVSFDNS